MADWFEGLTERQRKFCEAYSSNGGNAFAAAREAGYKHPAPSSAETLKSPKIIQALEKLRESRTSSAIMTREERQEFWSQIARDKAQATRDRLKAAELLGKSQADFIDRKEITGKDGAPLMAEVRVVFVGKSE
jgi:phage terminase small subunit